LFGFKKVAKPSAQEALAGREQPIRTASEHFINHHPLQGPYPEGSEKAIFGLGCFWGAEKKFWELGDGVFVTAAGYAGGLTPNPTYEEVCSGRTGHNEVVLVVFDPKKISYETLLKTFWESHDPAPGQRRRHAIPFRHLHLLTGAAKGRRGFQGDVREGAGKEALRRHHHRNRRCPAVLFRRGLPSAIPGQEPVRLLRAGRHWRVLPDRYRRQARRDGLANLLPPPLVGRGLGRRWLGFLNHIKC
jgi:peptide-methionine (S)-S-oxide reductase